MKCLALSLSCLLAVSPAKAAELEHRWSKDFGDEYGEHVYELTIDAAGNVIAFGAFDSPLDLGAGPMTPAGSGYYIAKFAPEGTCLWSKPLPVHIRGLDTDGAGNIVISGSFFRTLDLGEVQLVGDNNSSDAFIAKLNPDGKALWASRFASEPNYRGESGFYVAIDLAGNLLVSNTLWGSIDLGGGEIINSDENVFLAKFDPDGNHLWSKRFYGWETETGYVAVKSNGDVVLWGRYDDYINLDSDFHRTAGDWDIYVATFDTNGELVWSRSFGGTGRDKAFDLVLDSSDRAVMLGTFVDAIDFGGGALVSPGTTDWYLAKLGTDGSHVWSRQAGGPEHAYGSRLTIDGADNLMLGGTLFGEEIDLGGGPMTSEDGDVYIAQLDAMGDFQWSRIFPGPQYQILSEMATGEDGTTVLGGFFSGSVDFGGGMLSAAMYKGDEWSENMFLATFAPQATAVTPPAREQSLMQNYPNPFNPTTTIEFILDESASAVIEYFDATGARVAKLDRGRLAAGTHYVQWDGRDASGNKLGSGVYFYRLAGAPTVTARKMTLLK